MHWWPQQVGEVGSESCTDEVKETQAEIFSNLENVFQIVRSLETRQN